MTISIHALREEGDQRGFVQIQGHHHFYPRPPRGGRPCRFSRWQHIRSISIHALREEGDPKRTVLTLTRGISIHALREEGDPHVASTPSSARLFLSTPSARRATRSFLSLVRQPSRFLSTPSARRATITYTHNKALIEMISIHALREEGDTLSSTPDASSMMISIHALREEGDDGAVFAHVPVDGISIHALREEGDAFSNATTFRLSLFLSTPSARRATAFVRRLGGQFRISIHALREEGDVNVILQCGQRIHFYPRPPRGGRPEIG